MRIAYLILAHEQPRQFKRLVSALRSKNVHFFVNVDGKAIISEFLDSSNSEYIAFIKNRLSVNHGGFSLTQTMINLLKTASEENGFGYFIFLSGRDYPSKDNLFIHDFLERHYPTNFINHYPLVGGADLIRHLDRYYFIDLLGHFPKPLQKALRAIQFGLQLLLPRRSFLNGITPYRGSQWFCLAKPTADYVLDFIKSYDAKRYVRYFKYTFGSDEMFFQTIILNSRFACYCLLYDHDIVTGKAFMQNENKAYLHYIDWDERREGPAILSETDFKLLNRSNFLFARKVCQERSRKLLGLIDNFILRTS